MDTSTFDVVTDKIFEFFYLIKNQDLSTDEQKALVKEVLNDLYLQGEKTGYKKALMDCSNLIKNLIE